MTSTQADGDCSQHSRLRPNSIGYTLATTPPPKPIEDIEKEIEEELKEVEGEARQG
jgi:predicted DNA-binding transcriptional regulator